MVTKDSRLLCNIQDFKMRKSNFFLLTLAEIKLQLAGASGTVLHQFYEWCVCGQPTNKHQHTFLPSGHYASGAILKTLGKYISNTDSFVQVTQITYALKIYVHASIDQYKSTCIK